MDGAVATDTPFGQFPESALDGSIVDRFDTVVRRFPTRVAVSDAALSLTYSQLAAFVDRIAVAVAAATNERAGPVAIFRANDALYAAAILGILAAGRGYVPLDAGYPIQRNRLIASHAGLAAVISDSDLAGQARELVPGDVPVVDIADAGGERVAGLLRRPGPNDLAHILYTSGSTAAPKGVYQNHRGRLHTTLQRTNALRLTQDDRLALFHSPSTVDGARVALAALLNGASLHVLAPQHRNQSALAEEIRARGITVWHSVPTLFRHLAAALPEGARFDSVRIVHLSGERVDWKDLRSVERCCAPGARLVVGLGSTESCASYVQWFVDEKTERAGVALPIGREVADFRLAIVDQEGKPVRDGAVGEIVVSSRYIALGYWNDPELTSGVFHVDANDPERRILKTGDLGRRRPDGLLEFVGRKDHQIKLHGHRIELDEIELALNACPGVEDAAIVVRRNKDSLPGSLAAYVERKRGADHPTPRELTAALTKRLPSYMIPAKIAVLNDLPRLPNLKIDRIGLTSLDAERRAAAAEPIDDPLIAEVAGIFEAVLEVFGAGPDDNVASLGGDSLQAVKLAVELEARFGVAISANVFESTQTIAEMARWIAVENREHKSANLMTLVDELEVAFKERRPPRFERASESSWIDAILHLLQFGPLAVAEHGVRQLQVMFPAIRIARHLGAVFDKMPPSGDQLPFDDDVTKEIQIVEREGAKTVVLLFSGDRHGLGLPISMVHRWHGRMNASLIYLRDFQRCRYLGGVPSLGATREATLGELRRIIGWLGARRVVCYGISAGVFGALHYALDLNADAVLCIGGRTDLSLEFDRRDRQPGDNIKGQGEMPRGALDLRRAYERASRPPRVRIVYAQNSAEDRFYAEHMRGLSCVTLQSVEDSDDHNAAVELIKRGQFDETLNWLVPQVTAARNRMASARGWPLRVRLRLVRSFRGDYGIFGRPRDLYIPSIRVNWSVSASAVTEPRFGPESLLGPRTVIWHAPWRGEPQWVRFDADRPVRLRDVTMTAQDGHPDRAPRSFRFQAGDDGRAWQDVLTVDDARFAQPTMSWPLVMSRACRHFRIEVLANNGAPDLLTIQRIALPVVDDSDRGIWRRVLGPRRQRRV